MSNEDFCVLDAERWKIVYSFFYSKETKKNGYGLRSSGIFSGISGAIGIVSGISLPDAAMQGFNSGRLASLVWEADEASKSEDYWRAEITVTAGMGIDELLIVSVVGANNKPIDNAHLILLNSELVVCNGIAHYSLTELQRNLENTQVLLVYPDGRNIPGVLRLG